jgi:hypothetical protein
MTMTMRMSIHFSFSPLDAELYRRLLSLLYRRFPNLQVVHSCATADLEIGDTAGLETCGTVYWTDYSY